MHNWFFFSCTLSHSLVPVFTVGYIFSGLAHWMCEKFVVFVWSTNKFSRQYQKIETKMFEIDEFFSTLRVSAFSWLVID
jgi:hypothetical protein